MTAAATHMGSLDQPIVCSTTARVATLPDHILELIAAQLAGGSRTNFSQACRAFSQAVRKQAHKLDLHELCGHGDSLMEVPQTALVAAEKYPTIKHLVLPNGWRHQQIQQLLYHAALCAKTWRQLARISIHLQALGPSTSATLAQLVPTVSQLRLSQDLVFEQTKRQLWRMTSLLQLTQLRSLVVEADLRAEALQALSGLSRLNDLQLMARCVSSHSAASLRALAGLSSLTSLRFNWQAGRTLTDGRLLSNFTSNLIDLQIWILAGRNLPPCSSKPLTGMLAALGSLTSLTSLQLLQGLYMSWDLRTIRHLTGLTQLKVLGLHDSVLSESELALLAPCSALTTLKVDSIKLQGLHNFGAAAAAAPEENAEFAAGQAAYMAAAGLQDAAANNSSSAHLQPHLKTLQRLQHLEVNMLQLGLWQLWEVCPKLQTLTPLECTLGHKGHGVVWDLGCIEGHAQLQTFGLMIGALGSTISYNAACDSNDAASVASAVVRLVLQSAGISKLAGAPSGCSIEQLLTVLQSLPSLRSVQLWGHAGGPSGAMLESLQSRQSHATSSGNNSSIDMSRLQAQFACADCIRHTTTPAHRARDRCSSHGEAGSSSSSNRCASPDAGFISSSSIGSSTSISFVGGLLNSLGALVSPRNRCGVEASLPPPAFAALQHHQLSDSTAAQEHTAEVRRCGSCTHQACSDSHEIEQQLLVELLTGVLQLQQVQLVRCEHIAGSGLHIASLKTSQS